MAAEVASEVAEATPSTGVVNTQEVAVEAPTKVLAASIRATVAEVLGKVMVVASVPARVRVLLTVNVFPAANVNVPVELVIVMALSVVAVAAPRTGVIKVGDVCKTIKPVPVVPEIVVEPIENEP